MQIASWLDLSVYLISHCSLWWSSNRSQGFGVDTANFVSAMDSCANIDSEQYEEYRSCADLA